MAHIGYFIASSGLAQFLFDVTIPTSQHVTANNALILVRIGILCCCISMPIHRIDISFPKTTTLTTTLLSCFLLLWQLLAYLILRSIVAR